ncbi:hypothetical protein E2809_07570 [Campylobacter coli]|nr:hypothetical protein [Campylobacter coli]
MHKGRDDLISPEEAEKGVEIVSKICGVDKEKIHYPTVECNGPSISEYKFDYFPPSLLHTDFKYEIKFINCKFGSWEDFNLYNTSNNFLVFVNCEFDYICLNNDLVTDNTFKLNNKLYFFGCKFNGDIDIGKANINGEIKFNGCTFKDVFYFDIKEYLANIKIKNCIFYKSFFMSGNFKNEARFDNSIFKDYVDFHECEFKKTACFYGVRFDKTPNFSQAIFKENLNVVNTNLNFTFGNLQERIKQEYKDFNKTKEKKSLDKFANDFRDSFRTFKNALIKDNNLLDASNFHKYELYCKELELKFKKLKIFSREWIEKWQLFFYRKLCDHHTDLLLNLRWLVVVVGFFVSVLFALRYGDGNLLQFFNKDNDLLKMLKDMLNIKVLNDSNVTYLILLYSFIGLFFVRTFFIFYYLVIFILMLAISPYNLFSVVNFVVKGKLNSFLENIIMVTYALIMILVLFSLQKTARKSSIVPS